MPVISPNDQELVGALKEALETIARNRDGQGRWFDELLGMNLLATGTVRPDVQRSRLAQVVEGALESLHGSIEALQVVMDVLRQPSSAPVEDPEIRSEVSLEGLTVLVIDDEVDARELLGMVLERARAQVIIAGSSEEAYALVTLRRPDIIVSDIGMPSRDGYQLMRSIRLLPTDRGGRTPAVALTAFSRSEDRTRALLAGYQAHLTKPIAIRELIATLASLVGRV